MADAEDQITASAVALAGTLPSEASARKHVYVVVLEGDKVGAVHRIGEIDTAVGIAPGAVSDLPDAAASEARARLAGKAAVFHLIDLGGEGGTPPDVETPEPGAESRFDLGGGTLLKVYFGDQLQETLHRGLYESSVHDWLTGLFNRRYLEERLPAEFSFAARHGTPLSFLMIDPDGLRAVNEAHGRKAGDQVLRDVAQALRRTTRTEDIVARYSGEEFAVLARHTTLEQAAALAERIRVVADDLEVDVGGAIVRITLSVGVACFTPSVFPDHGELVEAAYRALVRAKREGRDRVIRHDDPVAPT